MQRQTDPARSLDEMCDEIVARYHVPLHRSLVRIGDELESLAAAMSTPALTAMWVAFADLAAQIEGHLAKEEHLLFPAFQALASAVRGDGEPPSLPFSTVLHPIRVMEAEHARIEQALSRVREAALTVDAPAACAAAWDRCLQELAALDADLREHHRTEDSVLFPHAIDVEHHLL